MNKARKFLLARPLFFRSVFIISWVFSLGLFVGGFFVPPVGTIDGSVLKAAGILLGFSSLSMLPDLVAAGRTATIEHGETKVTIQAQVENGHD